MKTLDWAVVALYAVCALLIGVYFTKKASRGIEGYFMAGRSLPWWAIGPTRAISANVLGVRSRPIPWPVAGESTITRS